MATVDSWGRRPLLLAGVGGIVASLLALGAAGSGWLPFGEGTLAWTNLGALLLYVGSYQVRTASLNRRHHVLYIGVRS